MDEDGILAGVDHHDWVGGRSSIQICGEMMIGVPVLYDGDFGHLLRLRLVFDSPIDRLYVGYYLMISLTFGGGGRLPRRGLAVLRWRRSAEPPLSDRLTLVRFSIRGRRSKKNGFVP